MVNTPLLVVCVVTGVVTVFGGAGGFLLSSIIIKRLSLTSGQQLRAIFFLAIFTFFVFFTFGIQCTTAPLAPETAM